MVEGRIGLVSAFVRMRLRPALLVSALVATGLSGAATAAAAEALPEFIGPICSTTDAGAGAGAALSARTALAFLSSAQAQEAAPAQAAAPEPVIDPSVRPPYREPVVLASEGGVLEVRLTARQSEAVLDTVAVPVKNFLLYDYELIRGTASNGERTGTRQYPAPTLQVFPGEKLVVHMENALSGLTIRDFFSPAYTPVGGFVPLYPPQLETAPINLHTHGLHVTPKGNGDNVLLYMPAGTANTHVYDIPMNMPQGMYWYHPHLHGLTSPQVYMGLAGMLAIGRPDGGLPVVTERGLPVRSMALQVNYVAGRALGRAELNNTSWPMWMSTIVPPKPGELEDGTYRPLLTPTGFEDWPTGSKSFTVWYAGPLSIDNKRAFFSYIPSNLQRFTASGDDRSLDVPPDPALPDHARDVQFTVNGQFQPVLKAKPGQTEIWVLANISDLAYITVRLTETATGRHPPIMIVGQDGNPYPAVHTPPIEGGTRLVIPPASRFAIAVTMPAEGDLVLDMPPLGYGAKALTAPGVLYTNTGTDKVPAVLGNLSVEPTAISYFDGFFSFPSQMLLRAEPDEGRGETVAFVPGQELGAFTSFDDVSEVTPDVTRTISIVGGFLNDMASKDDPKSFTYSFDGGTFPNVPLLQPRLGSVEEWRFVNYNNDEHPIHIHVNDFQTMENYDPTTGLRTGPDKFGLDNVNVAAPTMGSGEAVVEPGYLSLRTKFEDYGGVFVMHCHRLNHEDNGLMMIVSVIPAVSSYAVAVPGAAGTDATVRVVDGTGDRPLATVTPFPGYAGLVATAMGDVDDDGVLDLVVGSGPGRPAEVVVFAGAARNDAAAFTRVIARFAPFGPEVTGGITVASAQIDGGSADNIIVGSAPGQPSEVRVYGGALATTDGEAPPLFASFAPYAGDTSGVTITTGLTDFATGRFSIVTAPGPGTEAEVKLFAFPLLTVIDPAAVAAVAGHGEVPPPGTPRQTAAFKPFGDGYTGGVSLATGWFAGQFGGAERIVVGQTDGGAVKVFSSGSALDGGPDLYLHSPNEHGHGPTLREIAGFTPFEGGGAVRVAATSTTTGADLLVAGAGPDGTARVVRYDFDRSAPDARDLAPKRLREMVPADAAAFGLGGD
ncbi:multicopper oxidase domain-containing protein [Pseudoxanthobacter sp. M-2]|uniref:multicopper oxidase family protein n=1 Tax=Pseudoxanthobacter sp. M-2 TaxID=3078754 RepID=UPI0038FC37C1